LTRNPTLCYNESIIQQGEKEMGHCYFAVPYGWDLSSEKLVEDFITSDLEEAKQLVKCMKKKFGIGVQFRKFKTEEDAIHYLHSEHENSPIDEEDAFVFYVDGSSSGKNNKITYGFVVFQNSRPIYAESGRVENKETKSLGNVAGELTAAMKALDYAAEHHYRKVIVRHDFDGISYLQRPSLRQRHGFIEFYTDWIMAWHADHPQIHTEFEKVKGHSGVQGNNWADRLAKRAWDVPFTAIAMA
jgi:ribonuclease HI